MMKDTQANSSEGASSRDEGTQSQDVDSPKDGTTLRDNATLADASTSRDASTSKDASTLQDASTVQDASTRDTAVQPKSTRFPWLPILGIGLLLLIAAWAWAIVGGKLETDSILLRFLNVGMIPWLIQWMGISLVLLPVIRWSLRSRDTTDLASRLIIFALPLCMGLAWWLGVLATYSGQSIADVMLSSLTYELQYAAGSEPWMQGIVRDVIGPLVCPIKLAGPIDLRTADYWWSLGSTAWITLLWTLAIRGIQEVSSNDARLRQMITLATLIALYTAPVLARALMRLSSLVLDR